MTQAPLHEMPDQSIDARRDVVFGVPTAEDVRNSADFSPERINVDALQQVGQMTNEIVELRSVVAQNPEEILVDFRTEPRRDSGDFAQTTYHETKSLFQQIGSFLSAGDN